MEAKNSGMTLVERVNGYLEDNHMSIKDLADKIAYSRSTLSRYLNGKYDSPGSDVEVKLEHFLQQVGAAAPQEQPEQTASPAPARKPQELYYSNDAQSIVGLCSSCQEDMALGLVTGKPGFGKTHTLKYFARAAKVVYVECDDTMGTKDFVAAIERSVGMPQRAGTVCERTNALVNFFNANRGYLLILDEADKLISRATIKKMEIIRKFYDRADVGVVIAGEPVLEVLIRNFDGRFANRIDLRVELTGLKGREVEDYVKGYRIAPEALDELKSRATNKYTGCFRLLTRTLNNVSRLMAQRGGDTVTLPIIQEASAMMLL